MIGSSGDRVIGSCSLVPCFVIQRSPFDGCQYLLSPVIPDFDSQRDNQHQCSGGERNREGDVLVGKHQIGRNMFDPGIDDCSQNAEQQDNGEGKQGQ